MIYYAKETGVPPAKNANGHSSIPLLGKENGCVNNCYTGISYYFSVGYTPPSVHDDQEGFFVVSGKGYACIGDEEFEILPRMSFIAPAGVPHKIRSADPEIPLELFWFHAQA
jgi:mannose-6-phosphate isomerase-like protein (cupin superfamily)